MIKFIGTSAIQAHPVNEFGAIIDGNAIANILSGGTESMVKFTGTSALQYHPIDEFGNIIDATAIANAIGGGSSPTSKPTLPQDIIYVRTDGNNSNDGFSDSPSGAVQNVQGAIAVLKQYRGLPLVTISMGASTAIAPIFWDDTAEALELGDNYNEIRISGQGIGSTYLEAGSGGFLFLDGASTPQRLRIFFRNFSFNSGSASEITYNDHLFLEFQSVDFENTGVRFTVGDYSRLDIQVSCNFAAHTYNSGSMFTIAKTSYLDLRDLLNNLTFSTNANVFSIQENSYGRTNIISATVNGELAEVEEGSGLNVNGTIVGGVVKRDGKIANIASEVIVIDTPLEYSGDFQCVASGIVFDIFPTGSTYSPEIGQRITITNSGTQPATVQILSGVSSTALANSERIYLQRAANTGAEEWTYHKESISFLQDS